MHADEVTEELPVIRGFGEDATGIGTSQSRFAGARVRTRPLSYFPLKNAGCRPSLEVVFPL